MDQYIMYDEILENCTVLEKIGIAIYAINTSKGSTIVTLGEILNKECNEFFIGDSVIVRKHIIYRYSCGGAGPVIEFKGVKWYPGFTYSFIDANNVQQYYVNSNN